MPESPARPKTPIIDLYGAYVRPLGGWLAVADLITLMGQLGFDAVAVRSAVSRMTRRGLLRQEKRGGSSGYLLTEQALELLEEGDLRIFGSIQPANLSEGWVLVSFSVPETERDKRHQLRAGLQRLGFGNLDGGLWLAPRRRAAELNDTVERLGLQGYVDVFEAVYQGFDDLADLVSRSWDLEHLRGLYGRFLAEVGPVWRRARRSAAVSDLRAFVDYTMTLHRWRKFPYLDPGLPVELLPLDWEGRKAAVAFHEVRAHLERPAQGHVEATVTAR